MTAAWTAKMSFYTTPLQKPLQTPFSATIHLAGRLEAIPLTLVATKQYGCHSMLKYARAAGLCDFIKEKNLGGPGWGYESIIRMNEGFEVIW